MLLPAGETPAVLTIDGEHIVEITAGAEAVAGALNATQHAEPVIDAGSAVVMPGVIDVHVHINDPGRADWEGFESAGRAAAAGGVTTVVDMPLNSDPVTTTPQALARKVAALDSCRVDVGLWGGAVPENVEDLDALLDAGVLGLKCFLVPSGLDAFAPLDGQQLELVMRVAARREVVLLAHAEWPALLPSDTPSNTQSAALWAATRPAAAEVAAIARLIDASRRTGCAVHVVHLAAAEALSLLSEARCEGVPITVETCPHYLWFCSDDVPSGATTFKCAPPVRGASNREALWRGLTDGTIDLVATDHSPSPPALKHLDTGDFMAAWGGIASLQLLLPALWTGMRARGLGLGDLVEWLCAAPARRAGLDDRKGQLAVGYDADIVLWHPDTAFEVDAIALHHRHALTPYDGRKLFGVVERTVLRGRTVFADGRFPGKPGGRWLRRGAGS